MDNMSMQRKDNKTIQNKGRKMNLWREVLSALTIFTALLAQVLSLVCFYKPAGIIGGGVTGISMLLDYATNGVIQSWMVVVAINIPLLALSVRKLNVRFAIYTVCATATFSLLLGVFQNLTLPPVFDMENPIMPLISVLFGALIMGGAGALIVRNGASTGGTEVLSILVNRKIAFSVGSINMAMNLVVLLVFAQIGRASCRERV